jgi:protoporphyrinogen oxidase
VILGAGPSGVGAAWRLHRAGKAQAIVLEKQNDVGGNAGSFVLEDVPVDYGSHRLHPSCQPQILEDIRTLLGDDLLDRPRHGRIRLRGQWIHFPLEPLDLLLSVPWSFGLGVARDALRRAAPNGNGARVETFGSVLERGLGKTICHDFYAPYAVKVWGLSADELSPVQAYRRVSAGSQSKLMRRVLALAPGLRAPGAGRFFYPRRGYGQISQAMASAAQAEGADIRLRTTVRSVQLGKPHRIEMECDGITQSIEAEHVWSTIPLTVLARIVHPQAPPPVHEASARLEYRAMILIYLVLDQPQFSEFDAHYFPELDVKLTRLSEPKNYSGTCTPADRTVLCGELPCSVGDATWQSSDAELADLVRDSLGRCGLSIHAPIRQVVTKRLPFAYPIYRRGYEAHFEALDTWAAGLDGVLTLGRQGLFAHDNTHHTLAMAYAAVDSLNRSGEFDWTRWKVYRKEFESHVVED